ncbi:MAG: carboxypeptidase regulatory-like domain-containing protein [Acidobacteriota bacterium]
MRTWNWMKGGVLAALAISSLLGGAVPALAQADARFAGSVRDQTGAMITGAVVTVRNEKTGEERTARTNEQGLFLITGLRPSAYTVRAAHEHLQPAEYAGIRLAAAQELHLDVELTAPGITESVTVEGRAPMLDLSSATIGANVNEREVRDLPINGRQMSQLYLQAPGSVNSGTGTFGDIRFSGRAVQQNVIRFDGIEGTGIIDASPGNLNGEIPSPFRLQSSLENVQEFRVESNTYPAEYGTGTGGQISVVTKSGSNRLNGSAFYYVRDDRFDSKNYFDLEKSPLSLKQFGGSLGGPLVRDRAFFFGSYEGYRLRSGINFIEAVPSAAAFARGVPAIQPLYNAFRGPGAVVLPGASSSPDYDILQLNSTAKVDENAFSGRVDIRLSDRWSTYVRAFGDRGDNTQPEGVTGRVAEITANPANAVWGLQGVLSSSTLNEFKVGYNSAPTQVNGIAPGVPGVDLSNIVINLSGSVANTGIAGQGASSGLAIPGGLLRQNSASNGRGAPYKPYSLSFIDTLTTIRGRHSLKFGGEYRLIRMTTDRLGGTTYTWSNLNDFLANKLQSAAYLSDLSEPSPFNDGATGPRHTEQTYGVLYAQDEWKMAQGVTLNAGLRYEYYTPLRERDDLQVKYDVETGTILPNTTTPFRANKDNFMPRLGFTWAPGLEAKTVLRAGVGLLMGPGQTEDQIQPIESDRISASLSGGAYPVNIEALRANFLNNPLNRQYQPRAYTADYNIPERVWQYSASVERQLPWGFSGTVGYIGSQGRNLFLRSITNQIVEVRTNANPTQSAIVIRQWDIVNADGTISRPYAEIDVKTSGGHDSYNAVQASLARRFNNGLTLNSQYTFSRSYGNTAGSNEALTAANNAVTLADFDYENGYNRFDVRHTFNLSALYSLPYGSGRKWGADANGVTEFLLGGWDVGTIVNARSGLPLQVGIVRPDVVYRNTSTGALVSSPCGTCVAVINTPGGGASRNVRRPNLVPGVNPYLKDGLQWLNPAAFSIPEPGEFGNLKRGELRGPNFKQVDLLVSKRFATGRGSNVEFRWEIFNLFNTNNFDVPPTTLPNALGTGTNQLQPDQPFTAASAGSFGKLRSTVGTTVGLGTNRQMQFALRVIF